jgi:hypothetical protein
MIVANKKISCVDFTCGVFEILCLKGYKSFLWDKNFYQAVAKIFEEFRKNTEARGYDVRFRIVLHSFHNDSAVIDQMVSYAIQFGIAKLELPNRGIIYLKHDEITAKSKLDDSPLGNLFLSLADQIDKIFSEETKKGAN